MPGGCQMDRYGFGIAACVGRRIRRDGIVVETSRPENPNLHRSGMSSTQPTVAIRDFICRTYGAGGLVRVAFYKYITPDGVSSLPRGLTEHLSQSQQWDSGLKPNGYDSPRRSVAVAAGGNEEPWVNHS